MKTDVSFHVFSHGGRPIPVDHAYAIYSALSRILPELHVQEGFGIHPICGTQMGNRLLMLNPSSRLTIRIEPERIAMILPLAGRSIGLGSTILQIGVPTIHALTPSPILRSRLVTIKGFMEPELIREAIRRQLDQMEIGEKAGIYIGTRRTLRIHEKEVVGFETILTVLTEAESIQVQEVGMGGRRKMGCGIMSPYQFIPSGIPMCASTYESERR